MRQINIKELKKNLSRELQDLPFEITKFGRVVGVVSEKGSHLEKVVTTPKKKKKGSHNVAEKVAAVMVKDLLRNGTYIHPEETPWVNPLSNTVLAPKK